MRIIRVYDYDFRVRYRVTSMASASAGSDGAGESRRGTQAQAQWHRPGQQGRSVLSADQSGTPRLTGNGSSLEVTAGPGATVTGSLGDRDRPRTAALGAT